MKTDALKTEYVIQGRSDICWHDFAKFDTREEAEIDLKENRSEYECDGRNELRIVKVETPV